MRRSCWLVLLVFATACRGESPDAAATIEQHELDSMVVALMPAAERATGLTFRAQPRAAVRSPDQVRAYLLAKLATELPAERIDGIVTAYRLLGLISDTLDIPALFVDLYTEQVAGFYDPDSTMLYAVSGTSAQVLNLTLTHELVHALQHQYLPLDSILASHENADRLAAAQAVLEGQATLATLLILLPDEDLLGDDALWQTILDQFGATRAEMAVFNAAPLVVRSGLLFPYREGSSFMRWFKTSRPGEQPFDALLPASTEQILHPERYQDGDPPISLRFIGSDADVMHEDTFGEYEMHVLRAGLAGITTVATDPALGWGGDRMRVYRSPEGPALVWYSVWDRDYFADRFVARVVGQLARQERDGSRITVDRVPVGELPGVRVVIAPDGWSGWGAMPAVTIDDGR